MAVKFGHALLYYREAAGLKQNELAVKLDVRPEHLCRLECGTVTPSLSFLRRFARVAGVSEKALFRKALEE